MKATILGLLAAMGTAGCAAAAAPPLPAATESFPAIAEAPAPVRAALPAFPASDPAVPLFAPSSLPEGPGGREIPPADVRAPRTSEEDPVGPSGQPEWTTRRRFARNRVYVIAPWQVETELWSRTKIDRGEGPDQLFQGEVSLGLPYRFQVDYYQNVRGVPHDHFRNAGPQVEGRWAFADWGRLPGNPAIYGEYKWDYQGADKYEAKLLLGDTVAPRWHAAANLILEQETSEARETELAASGAVSYTLIDRKLSVGAEVTFSRLSENGNRDHGTWEAALGPSLQWRFHPRAHLDIVPMFGLNPDSTDIDLFLVLGWDFGGGDEGRLAPTATKSK